MKFEPKIATLIKANLTNTTDYERTVEQRNMTLKLYSIMICLGILTTFARVYFNFFFSLKASRNIHKAMIASVLNSVMTFFDNNYIGNIVNRFSKDLNNIDEILPVVIYETFRVKRLDTFFIIMCLHTVLIFFGLNILFIVEHLFVSWYCLPDCICQCIFTDTNGGFIDRSLFFEEILPANGKKFEETGSSK